MAPARRLVGDVGGTNARFGLVGAEGRVEAVEVLACARFASLEAAVLHYLRDRRVDGAVLAIAGPVTEGAVAVTNLAWRTSEAAIAGACGIAQVWLCNDYAALAHAAPRLAPPDLHHLGGPQRPGAGVVAVVGAGTGFGVSALVGPPEARTAVVGEGGHVAFAPGDAVEIEILRRLTPRYGRVSLERILSGPGLAALHSVLREIVGAPPSDCDAAAVTERAGRGEPHAVAAIDRFCAILGAAAGDVALLVGAREVQIAGGLAPRLLTALDGGGFRARFEAKGRFAGLMCGITTRVVLHPYAALIGAAAMTRQVTP